MDLSQLLILQLIAHLISDFTFQPKKMSYDKNTLGFKSKFLKWHILIIFLSAWFFSFQVNFVYGAFAIAIVHWITDGTKKHIKKNKIIGQYSFFLDQIIHIVAILSIVIVYNNYFQLSPVFNVLLSAKSLLIVGCYILITKPSNIIIKETFSTFKIEVSGPETSELPNAGKLIGSIERILVLTFVIINQFEAVGFLIAAKSILRFKDDNIIKTEYVLIGTMLSFGIAIILGIIISF